LSILTRAGAMGGAVGLATGVVPGVVGAAGIAIAGAMRNAGIKSADTILRDAMLDPKLAALLLDKALAKNPRQALELRKAILRAAGMGAVDREDAER
jgi:hypothetical protein